MNRIIIFWIMITVSCSAMAQVSLDATNAPRAESEYYFIKADLHGLSLNQAGAGINWDLSGVSLQPDTIVNYYTKSPEYNAFPNHSYPDYYFDTSLFNLKSFEKLYKVTNDRYSLGYLLVPVEMFGKQAVGADITILTFPLNYQDSWSQTWSAGMISMAYRNVIADAYGCLVLPDTTYESTLRIRTLEKIEYRPSSPTPHASYDTVYNDTYDWYTDHAELPVFTVTYHQLHRWQEGWYSVNYDTTALKYLYCIRIPTTGNIPSESDIIVYPVPSSNTLTIKNVTNDAYKITLRVVNIRGDIVNEDAGFVLHPGENELKINTSLCPGGTYFIDLISGNNSRITKKVIIK